MENEYALIPTAVAFTSKFGVFIGLYPTKDPFWLKSIINYGFKVIGKGVVKLVKLIGTDIWWHKGSSYPQPVDSTGLWFLPEGSEKFSPAFYIPNNWSSDYILRVDNYNADVQIDPGLFWVAKTPGETIYVSWRDYGDYTLKATLLQDGVWKVYKD